MTANPARDHLRKAIQRARARTGDAAREAGPEEGPSSASDWFRRFAYACSNKLGSHWAFIGAVLLILAWAATGPVFHFSENWQLVINTGTTIVTFLMVFLIQSTQNRDSKAVHLKLDELVRSSQARNVFADLESASDAELDALQREFEELRKRSRSQNGAQDPSQTGGR